MKKIVKLIHPRFFIANLLFASLLYGQINYEPLEDDIYKFLERAGKKGLIDYRDYVKPLSRSYIAEKLNELHENRFYLSRLELDEFKHFSRLFGNELDSSEFGDNEIVELLGYDKYDVWRAMSIRNNHFHFDANPIMEYTKGKFNDLDYSVLSAGISFKGSLTKKLNFNFSMINARLEPGTFDRFYFVEFINTPGINRTISDRNRTEYFYLDVKLDYSWDWGEVSAGKYSTTYGHEKSGNIILSNRATSYPNYKVSLKPFDWLSFDYLHGWLNSNMVDTSFGYATWRRLGYNTVSRVGYIKKYMGMHSLTFYPIKGLSLAIGESVVYNNEVNYGIMIPAPVPFSILGGYNGDEDSEDHYNSQWFFSLSSKDHIPNTLIYANFLADDLSVTSETDSSIDYSKYAFSAGVSIVDAPINNLTLNFEYTKIYPSTYQHYTHSITYKSSGNYRIFNYSLGHWAEDNADLLYGEINYRIIRGLEITAWGQQIKKGTWAVGNRGYVAPEPTFLFADEVDERKDYTYLGFKVKYNIWNFLVAKFELLNIEEATQQADETFKTKQFQNISFSIGYGI